MQDTIERRGHTVIDGAIIVLLCRLKICFCRIRVEARMEKKPKDESANSMVMVRSVKNGEVFLMMASAKP